MDRRYMANKKLGIYIHIPFCKSKCIYCDFFSAPAEEHVRKQYLKALCTQINSGAPKLAGEYEVDSIFFGGGTPSIMDAGELMNVLGAIYNNFNLSDDCEITIECNPGTMDEDKLGIYREKGVNRLSFGLQSVNDDELKMLGRIHSFEDFMESYEAAAKSGFDNINIDIMSGIPGQTPAGWRKTLRTVMMLRPAHISAYSLIIEDGTPLSDMYKSGRKLYLPSEDEEREMYHDTASILADNGYGHYEISNYALAGRECRHNIKYWTRGEYAGFGAGASSMIKNIRYNTTKNTPAFIYDPVHVEYDTEELTVNDCMSEFMFLGLRMMRGVNRDRFRVTFGRQMDNVFGNVISKYVSTGHIADDGNNVFFTDKGIDVSNYILADFLL